MTTFNCGQSEIKHVLAPKCCRHVIKELVHAFSCAYIDLWMHLGSLMSTQEARVSLGCASSNSDAFFVLSKLPACIHNSIYAKHEPILKFSTISDSHQFGTASFIAQQAVLWNAIGRSNGSILKCTDLKSYLKNVVNCHTFKDFNFDVSAPQIINRSENFIFF